MILPALAFSQNKKDNAIIIHENISMDKIVSSLFSNGFEINKTTESYISTEPKEMGSWSIKIAINKSDSILTIKAWFYMSLLSNSFQLVQYGGMKGSLARLTWNELDNTAKKISDKIEYIKQ